MKTTLKLITIFLLFQSSTIYAQIPPPSWQWANTSSGSNGEGFGVTIDHSGNIYQTGSFGDSITIGTQTLYNSGSVFSAFILAKYSNTGQVIWAQSPPLKLGYGFDVAADARGDIYVAGTRHPASFFSNIASLTKFDAAGNTLWADTPVAGGLASIAYSVSTDASGVYITGQYADTLIRFGQYPLRNRSTRDQAFMVRYSPAGAVLWARNTLTDTLGTATGISSAVDGSGHVYFAGTFTGADLTIDTVTIHIPIPSTQSSYLVQLDSSGHAIWTMGFAASLSAINDIAIDASGNICITGIYRGDSLMIGSYVLHHSNSQIHMFVAKISPIGHVLWVQAQDLSGGSSIAADRYNNIFVSGGLNGGPQIWDSIILNTSNLAGNINDHAYVLSLDQSGTLLCYQALACGGDDESDIAVDSIGNIYFSGDYNDSIFILGRDTLQPKTFGAENIFIARFTCAGLVNSIESISQNYPVSLYPNPNTGIATLTYTLPYGTVEAAILISDMLGREKQSLFIESTSAQAQLQTEGLGRGIYLYSLKANGKIIATQKMVVEYVCSNRIEFK
jgi:hypothetical protein